MRTNPVHGYAPVGFIDDDLAKVGQRIHGVKVLGTRDALRSVLDATRPDAVLIAISRAVPSTIRGIVEALEPFKVPIQRLPSLPDLLDRKVTVDHIRTLSVEDLLDRVPVALDIEPVREIVDGKRVLVTGAGGSIGAELCRQIASLNPGCLVMIDRYENGLHAVTNEVARGAFGRRVHAVVVDVTDRSRMRDVWETHRPTIVFHAAAHKHVPLMELNPCEAVLNNVRGARMLVESAVAYGVERFMLVSTDKAVNPASVMGATKRIAEMLVQTVNGSAAGIFAAVRFGNVLASNGSVVPLFLEQIRTGGPGDGDPCGHAPVFHAHSRGGQPGAAGHHAGQGERYLRPRDGRAGRRARAGSQPDPVVGLRARARHSHRLHRGAARREAS